MTKLKSQILSEVEEKLGPGCVMVVADAMEKCPTLSKVVNTYQAIYDLYEIAAMEYQAPVSMLKGGIDDNSHTR